MRAEYLVVLDLTDDPRHHPQDRAGLRCGADDPRPEWQMFYAALEAGQYVIEGGYPCPWKMPDHRHRPLAVKRYDDASQPFGEWIWTTARDVPTP